MRASQILPSIGFMGLMIASVSSAGPIGFDASLSKEKRLEAGAPCADGSCYHLDRDGGLAGVEAQVHKINIFDKNGKDPRVKQSFAADGLKYASIGNVTVNQPVPWMDENGKISLTRDLSGTGVMISPCLFLTNHHVVFGKSKNPDGKNFSVTFSSTESVRGKPVAWGPVHETSRPGDDWAIVEMQSDKCLGLKTGWFTPGDLEPKDLGKKRFRSGGYPVSKFDPKSPNQLYVDNEVKIYESGTGFYDDTFLNDGAVSGGNSGGPVWYEDVDGSLNIVGLQVGDKKASKTILRKFDKAYSNLAINVTSVLMNSDARGLLMADLRKHLGVKNKLAFR